MAVDRTSLTFTTGNWSTVQTVKVTAAEDDDAETDAAVDADAHGERRRLQREDVRR